MAIKTAEDLFIHELSDIYSAEKQLTKALPRLARAAENPDWPQRLKRTWKKPRARSSASTRWWRFSASG